ncbi:MAG: hypothetical protein KAX99_02245 [Azonexus sp.]|nr:hypothetical protein [Azonexus sp.]
MKPFYSIRELAELLDESVFKIVDGLAAYGITPIYKGEKADLSRWEYPKVLHSGDAITVYTGQRDRGPDPSHVVVGTDFLPESWKKSIGQAMSKSEPVSEHEQTNAEIQLATLFDSVKAAQLEAMFPDDGQWKDYAERAARNGLDTARVGRNAFNPYRAAVWWLNQGPVGWTWDRCLRKLANNLPARSIDSKHLLTGEYE